jgi:predicted phage tail component-like protein
MANSFSFGGFDLSSRYVYVTSDFELPQQEPKHDTSELVGRHGGYLLHSKYQIIDIKVPLIFKGYTDSAQFYTMIDAINVKFDVNLGEQELIFDYNPTRYLKAIVSSKLQVKKTSLTTATGSITFKVVDPFWYNVTETAVITAIPSSPTNLNIAPAGSVDAEPVFTFSGSGISSGHTYGIENLTCNRSLWWDAPRDLVASDEVIFDCTTWMVKLNGVASMATIEHSSNFIVLVPNISNTLRLTGFASHYLQYAFRGRWL